MKKYEEILQDKQTNSSTELVKIDIDEKSLTQVKTVEEALALADSFVPVFQKKVLMSEVGLPAEKKQQWLQTIDESMHAMNIVPQRRTMTEKTQAVLQQNRFPTASAKFHQAVLESSAYTGMLIDETFGYEEAKLQLEKKFYKYQQKQKKLLSLQAEGEDTFLLEKNLEIERLKLTKDVMSLKAQEKALNNKREELMEWSQIKKELYDEAMANGEIWSPDSIDGGNAGLQEIPLALRHLQNYIILKQNSSEGDISSVLNIEGLALTAVKEGMKKNKLGLYIHTLTDEQIKIVFLGIFGLQVDILRLPNFIGIRDVNSQKEFLYPTDLRTWDMIEKSSKNPV